ncbi:VWA domain-containing protein [Paractinoplanes atraurantiacus]|uniref:Ca-activated chloride channel family protein n=1 Tax=Paractinoplanes atraurantiacus TaxID=1036182 RepID=A0A285H2Y2_9ACTN|nr:VWA domain-containing protein [Actinoplanes atraurantiacus]SNY30127.1 Ca-activated chloride channel family protein [Actinoplanes atraurantiacus]
MSFLHPLLLIVAVVVTAAAVYGYVWLQRRRSSALAAAGFASMVGRGSAVRRHLPYGLILFALPVLLVGLARPQAELSVPHVSGTVLLAFDVSNSMRATDVSPSRLAAAQQAAKDFVEDQPDTVDVGVLVFGDQALLTQAPTDDHNAAMAAIGRLSASGGTSLGQAILVGLGTITGKPVALPDEGAPAPELGYWPSATIVVFSDGQETGGPDIEAAAELAAAAGVRIQTVGVGTAKGGTVEVDGFQLGTRLDEQTLTTISQVTGGAYHPAGDAAAVSDTTKSIDLRLTAKKEPVELTAPFAGVALLLLMLGALLGTRWHGRIV